MKIKSTSDLNGFFSKIELFQSWIVLLIILECNQSGHAQESIISLAASLWGK